MHHGGPYPAATDVHFTSVGTAAILRFARPICYQNVADDFLPEELQNDNPRKIWRLVDGKMTKDPVPGNAIRVTQTTIRNNDLAAAPEHS